MLLQGLDGISFLLVTGASLEEHLCNLEYVLDRLTSAGLKLNRVSDHSCLTA